MAVTGAGLQGVVATDSRLCYIDGDAGILSYQGYRIETLAENATFEEVIFLLWYGRLPKRRNWMSSRPRWWPTAACRRRWRRSWRELPEALRSHGVLRTAVSMLALYDPLIKDNGIEANKKKAIKLMAQTATIVTSFDRLRNGKEWSRAIRSWASPPISCTR